MKSVGREPAVWDMLSKIFSLSVKELKGLSVDELDELVRKKGGKPISYERGDKILNRPVTMESLNKKIDCSIKSWSKSSSLVKKLLDMKYVFVR